MIYRSSSIQRPGPGVKKNVDLQGGVNYHWALFSIRIFFHVAMGLYMKPWALIR